MPNESRLRKNEPNGSGSSNTATTAAGAPPASALNATTRRDDHYSTALVNNARDTAFGLARSARDWLSPTSTSLPDWSAPLSHLESLTTVMFSPLAAHTVYRSDSLAKALQLMQQQQQQRQRSNTNSASSSSSSSSSDLVLHRRAFPSSAELLKEDIPDSSAPLSLFQGFAAAYPTLTTNNPATTTGSPKRSRNRRRKHASGSSVAGSDTGRSLTQIIAEREMRMKENDKLQMQKSSTANEIEQINLQIEEMLNKRRQLEAKWSKLQTKEQQLQMTIDGLNEAIINVEEGGRETDSVQPDTETTTESDDEPIEPGICYKSLQGHDDSIVCLDFNHPKGMLVSSSMDGTVRAWDLHRNVCLGSLDGHTSVVRCLDLNEARLVTGSDDGSIKYWDLSAIPVPAFPSSDPDSPVSPASPASGEELPPVIENCCLGSLEGHQGEVTAIDSDGVTAVSGSNDKTMKQWDLETQQCVLTLDVMWASNTSTSKSWSFATDIQNYFFEPANEFVGALQFWNFALASGTIDGKIRMWDLRTGQAHRTLPGHNGPITTLQFDEIHIVSGSMDRTVRIWDLRTGSVFDTLTYNDPVSSLQFDASRIATATTSSSVDIYNRTSFQHTSLAGHTGPVNSVHFRDSVLASGGADRIVKFWAL